MKFLSIFAVLFISYCALEAIESIHSISEISAYVKEPEQILIAFDIDDTLTILRDPAFHIPNFRKQHRKVFETIMGSLTPEVEHLAFAFPLVTTPSDLIESETPVWIKEMQEKRMKLIALTAAMSGQVGGVAIEDRRRSELNRVGIDFSSSFPNLSEITFSHLNPDVLGRYPLFKEGILLANHKNDKGSVLIAFLKECSWQPDHVIVVDDRIEHLYAVETALKIFNPHIVFTGLHFKGQEGLYQPIEEKAFRQTWIDMVEQARLDYLGDMNAKPPRKGEEESRSYSLLRVRSLS